MKINNTRQSKHLAERRRRVAEAIGFNDEILLIGAGEPIPLPEGSDQTYPFCAHPEYYYLTESMRRAEWWPSIHDKALRTVGSPSSRM